MSTEASKPSQPGLSSNHVPMPWYFQWLLSREQGCSDLHRVTTTWADCGADWEKAGNSAGTGSQLREVAGGKKGGLSAPALAMMPMAPLHDLQWTVSEQASPSFLPHDSVPLCGKFFLSRHFLILIFNFISFD